MEVLQAVLLLLLPSLEERQQARQGQVWILVDRTICRAAVMGPLFRLLASTMLRPLPLTTLTWEGAKVRGSEAYQAC